MFNRAPQASAICLRSHLKRVHQNRSCRRLDASGCVPCRPRWQSTAVKAEHDDEVAQQTHPTHHEPVLQRPSQASQSEHDAPEKQRRAQPPIAFRRWRPHSSHELGMNVLGSPAEVLVVPTRVRKVAHDSPAENQTAVDVADRGVGGLQESLDSELRPVSMADVLQHIDALKLELGRGKDVFSVEEWENYTKKLGGGFTKSQLQEYLQRLTDNESVVSGDSHPPKNQTKHSLAASIMTDVWKWSCRDIDEVIPAAAAQVTRRHVTVTATKLEYIMYHEKQHLRHTSEAFGVQIDVFRKRNQIQLSGNESSVADAKKQLNLIVKSIKETYLRIPRHVREAFVNETKFDDLITLLMQKHKLLVKREQDVLRVIGPATTDANVILRDITLAVGKHNQTISYSYCMPTRPGGSLVRMQFHADYLRRWLPHTNGWYREVLDHYVDMTGLVQSKKFRRDESQSDTSDAVELRRLTNHVLKAEKPDQKRLSQLGVTRSDLSYEYIVDLGQALFRETEIQTGSESPVAEHKYGANAIFVSQLAMLPQILASKGFVPKNDSEVLTGRAGNKHARPLLLHLRLSPLVQSPRSPPIELVLSGRDATQGLRQQLEIKRVCAIVVERQHLALFPHRSMDISVKKRGVIDLLGSEGVEPKQPYVKILRQLGSHLEDAQSSSQAQLPPIWRINFPPLSDRKENAAESVAKNTSAASQEEGITTSQAETSNTHVFTYVLEPPEYLDVASYRSRVLGDVCVDHILCETDPLEQPRQRQILRMTGTSLTELLHGTSSTAKFEEATATVRKQQFKQSMDAAYKFARMLDNVQLTLGNPMEQSKPKKKPGSLGLNKFDPAPVF